MSSPRIVPIILSGGSGTRLWPLSRARYPKQFVGDLNGQASSLLSATLARLPPTEGFAAPIVVGNNAHRFLVREHAALAGVEPEAVILEPSARNTAPAIAAAALLLARHDPGTVLAVMPSDHVIDDAARFAAAVRAAAAIAEQGRIVLFGIVPSGPHTGYGYIRKGQPLADHAHAAFEVERFFEKPDAHTAQAYVEDGGYLWNSGIFVFRADTFLDELQRHEKGIDHAPHAPRLLQDWA